MHIAILIGRFPPGALGGAEHQAECWARRLSDRHRVTVVTRVEPPGGPGSQRRDGFDVVRLPVSRLPVWRTLRDLAGIERAVARLDPAPDVLLCFQTFISGFAGVRIQDHLRIPAVVWIRGEGEYRLSDSRFFRAVAPRVWSTARGVLVQSASNREALLDQLERFAPAARERVRSRLDVIPNGLDLPDPAPLPGSATAGRVLTVGRLIPDKGMDVVIDAVAALGGRLTLAGSGPERERLEARARQLGLDARFEGFVDRESLARLYAGSSCVVLGARRGEGLPNVVLEAMAFARPVVATPVAGVRDLITDGVNGLLVPPDDPRALQQALGRLSGEPGLAERLGAAARRAAEAFAWDQVRPRLEAALTRWAA